MVLNIFVLLVAAFVTYMWVIRGFFSALIHLVCTVIAGAVAFAVWEPLAYWLLSAAPTSGVTSHVTGMAWGISLIVPFAITLALLRVIVDQLLPGNVVINQKLNYSGGAVCGLAAGVLTAGIVGIGLSFFRTTPDFAESARYGNGGNIERQSALWLPIDKVTAGFYGTLSERSFRTSEPLAKWHPNLEDEGGTLLQTAFEGKNRNTTRPSDFKVIARFNVGEPGKAKFSSLLGDMWKPGVVQKVSDLDGKPFPEGSHIEGFVVNFNSGAKEKDGKVSIGSAQIRLLLENDNEERITVHPIAVSSQAASDKPAFGRWWYDTKGTFIASVGGGADALMAFEFPCPPGFRPIALYVKGARHVVDLDGADKVKTTFRSTMERDVAISSGLSGMGGSSNLMGELDMSGAVKVSAPTGENQQGQAPNGIYVSDTLRFVIQKGLHDQLEINEEGNKNIIINGEVTLSADAVKNARGIERNLIINRLLVAQDQVIVQVDTEVSAFSVLNRAFTNQEGNLPPMLFDNQGGSYQPVGFAYFDETKCMLRYTPGNPIQKMSDLPPMSSSRPAQRLTLIYRVSKGVSLKAFGCGPKITVSIDPPFLLNHNQGGGR